MMGSMGGNVGGGASLPGANLVVREVWFVLLEEEANTATATASFLETKDAHDSEVDKEELKFTY